MRIEAFLSQPSVAATPADVSIGDDLLETLKAHSGHCVGMAANMIGAKKRIIAIETDDGHLVMYNPQIVQRSQPYETEEGCLSLDGVRPTTRYQRITVTWQDRDFATHTKKFAGWRAQIIQHEVDHCDGILI